MAQLIRVGLESASVERVVRQITDIALDAAQDSARNAARRTAALMQREIDETGNSEFKDPTGEYVGSIRAGVAKEGDGYRAFLTVEGDERDIIKARIIEYGRGEKVIPINPKKKAMSWAATGHPAEHVKDGKAFAKKVTLPAVEGKHVLRKVRDRVYQRIRRGTV